MTVIIHSVGNGDLGNDIVNLSHEERLTMQAERLQEPNRSRSASTP